MAAVTLPAESSETRPRLSNRAFLLLVVLIICCAVLRSAIATRLDDFTLDEPYHIVAGVSYVQRADFRINPEHPPLVKLWVGSIVSALGFRLSPFREFNDKESERRFVNEDVYFHNNPDALQHQARVAMWTLNGLLLILFAVALRRVFGPIAAIGTLLLLAIDPTVAAHLPVVMTDLPIALLSATAVLFAARAFVDWNWRNLAACSAALGLALATKHSAPVFCVILAYAGVLLALFVPRRQPSDTRPRRLAKLCAVFLGALVILWGFYRFRFTESPTPAEKFNRPLALKIADLRSLAYRFALTHFNSAHLLPRAYIWGFADIIRGGVEGRIESRLAFGKASLKAPAYFFPGVVAVKLPIGFDVLILIGVFLFFARRLPAPWKIPVVLVLLAALAYFFVLSHGASYAGMRHALPAMLLLSVFAGLAVHAAVKSRSMWLKGLVALAFLAAAVSALPALRPWEYYNELVGGSEHAYLYFNDEGVDLYQRNQEIARYYHEVLEPAHDLPFLQYLPYDQQAEYLRLDWVGHDIQRDEPSFQNPVFTGTLIVQARFLGPTLFLDWSALRTAKPIARFGDALVFRGSYNIAPILAGDRDYRARVELFSDKPDLAKAEHLFRQAVDFDPSSFSSFIELGNIYLSRGSRQQASEAFTAARDHCPAGSVFCRDLEDQVRLLNSSVPLSQIPHLRDPTLE
jgi:tetratricopeptide (TPR) repeat protein